MLLNLVAEEQAFRHNRNLISHLCDTAGLGGGFFSFQISTGKEKERNRMALFFTQLTADGLLSPVLACEKIGLSPHRIERAPVNVARGCAVCLSVLFCFSFPTDAPDPTIPVWLLGCYVTGRTLLSSLVFVSRLLQQKNKTADRKSRNARAATPSLPSLSVIVCILESPLSPLPPTSPARLPSLPHAHTHRVPIPCYLDLQPHSSLVSQSNPPPIHHSCAVVSCVTLQPLRHPEIYFFLPFLPFRY